MIAQRTLTIALMLFVFALSALSDNVKISDINVVSGNTYEDGGAIAVGSEVFFDKEVTILDMPDQVNGAQFIKGWNEDASWHFNNPVDPIDKIWNEHENFMRFTVDRLVKLWILFEPSKKDQILNTSIPTKTWIWDDFEDTGVVVKAKGSIINFSLMKGKKPYPPGQIILGSLGGSGGIMYVPLLAEASQAVQPESKLATFWSRIKVLD